MDHLQAWKKYRNLTFDDLPADVVKVASQCIQDWFGCALAGSNEPLAKILRGQFGYRSGTCSVIGSDLRLDAPTAALLNGASGHALDFDDTGARTLCHSTAPVMPAVLAVAEELGSSGKALMTALVVGVEIEGRIGFAMGPDHYARGWHTTATYGTFGATAAVAHLLGLNDEQYGVAMGLAASHASGVKANFGTMTKPYHPGRAAENGINCARLAAAGFTANPDAVLGNQGFVRAASNATDRTEALKTVADEWMILGTLFKYHAACHLTHAAIEGVLSLRTSLNVEDLSSLTITVNPGLLDVCGIENPKTGLEGKFSLRGTASLALNGIDTSSPETFVDDVISSETVQALIRKVTVETDPALSQFQSKVVWVDNAQNAHEAFKDLSKPVTDYDEQGRKLKIKFDSLCAFANAGDETVDRFKTLLDVAQPGL
ncbi:MAG: MmgE/PrpD family protein [Proteobacteria bacterium]|nr:MmgE/PrpD family protein [Pseudomonadota bacterium]